MASQSSSDLERALESLKLNNPYPHFASADVLNRPLDLCRSYLADILCSLVDCEAQATYNAIQLSNDPLHGDFTIVIPRLCPGAKATEVASDLLKKYPTNPLFDFPWPEGVYLRVCIKPEALPRLLLPYIIGRKSSYGLDPLHVLRNTSVSDSDHTKVIVEFCSPNIAGDFEGKHLRSTILGAFVSNIHECMGWKVAKVNYLGDWGKDIALLGVGWEKFGSEKEYEEDPVSHLLEVYHKIQQLFQPEKIAYKKARDEAKRTGHDEQEVTAEIEGKGLFAERNAFFKKMEDGDEQAVALFKRIRAVKVDEYTKFYARLGISFDEYSGESLVNQETETEIEQLLKDKEISEESGGAWVVDMKKHGAKAGTAIIRNRTGGSTYILRYLASVLERSRKNDFDKMIFVAADRTGHFTQLFKIFEALGMSELAKKLQHASFSDVSQMAEKLGSGYQLHGILDRCENGALESLKTNEEKTKLLGDPETIAKAAGITALLAQELATKKGSDHAFDIASMTSFKSGTGLDLQYQYARLCSILKIHPNNPELANEEYGSLTEEEHTGLLLLLGQYPEVVQAAFKSLEPSSIMAYLHSVTEKLEDCLDNDNDDDDGNEGEGAAEEAEKQPFIDGTGEEKETGETISEATITSAQSALYEATRIVLENGMKLLGLTPIAGLQPDRADTPVE